MEQSPWIVVRRVIRSVTRSFAKLPRCIFSDAQIATFYFWGTLHERPMTWAINPVNYNRSFRPRKIPSISQLNRRIASDRFQRILQKVHERLAGDSRYKGLILDGHALCVGASSQDRDARPGHAPGGMARGYKLHALATSDGNIPVFAVYPLNKHEMPVAREMLWALKHDLDGTLVMADTNYDAHELSKDVARRGGFLITPPRGMATHPVTRKQMGAARRTMIDLWQQARPTMDAVYKARAGIERIFGNMGVTPGLLDRLPKFVRSLSRVRRYVGVKICLYHAHRIAKELSTTEV